MNTLDRLDQLVHRLIEQHSQLKEELIRPLSDENILSGGLPDSIESDHQSERGGAQLDLPVGGKSSDDGKKLIKERILKLIEQIDDVLDREKITNE